MHNSELIFDFHSGFSENFEADQNGQYFPSFLLCSVLVIEDKLMQIYFLGIFKYKGEREGMLRLFYYKTSEIKYTFKIHISIILREDM